MKIAALKPFVQCAYVYFVHDVIYWNRSDSSVEVWDLAHTPHIERTIPGRVNTSVEAVTWCGERLFSAGLQGTITEYNLQTLSYKVKVLFLTCGVSVFLLTEHEAKVMPNMKYWNKLGV